MSIQLGESARDADSADAGQVGCDRENVGEIHLQWVSKAFTQFECCYGGRRRDQCIDFVKNAGEIPPNEFAHFLCTQVIRVVIAGAQNVSAKNDSPFHFRTKTLLSRSPVKIENVFGIFSTIPVTNAIEAREVRGGF